MQWSTKGQSRLLALMSPEDRKQFDFDFRKLDRQKWITLQCLGCKIYLLKEDMANLPKAKKRLVHAWVCMDCGICRYVRLK